MEPHEDKVDPSSKSKRMFVLGVVDTSGMKSGSSARKRRWDQPPEEETDSDGTSPSKVVIKDSSTSQGELSSKTEENIDDEVQDVFYDTSENVEEIAVEDSKTEEKSPQGKAVCEKLEKDILTQENSTDCQSLTLDEPDDNTILNAATESKVISRKPDEHTTSPLSQATNKVKISTVSEQVQKSQDKIETKTVAPVIISDSLKAIQFCYDEDDSYSSDGSEGHSSANVIGHTQQSIPVTNSVAAESFEEPVSSTGAPQVAKEPAVTEPALDVELEKDYTQQDTEVDDAAQVIDMEDSAGAEAPSEVNEEPVVSDSLLDSKTSRAVPPKSKSFFETDEIMDNTIFNKGNEGALDVKDETTPALSIENNSQNIVDEHKIPKLSGTKVAVKEKLEDAMGQKSQVDSRDAPSDQSDSSKPIADPSPEPAEQAQSSMISMDNSQNCCVSFDDMSNLDKTTCKSPVVESSYTELEEANNTKSSNPEITMHFASVRTQDCASTPDVEQENSNNSKDGSVVVNADSGLEGKPLDFAEETESQSQTTMEMLDSLVRRSSEDGPSRLPVGTGPFSEDSLINEINQLPDQEDDDENRESSKSGSLKKTDSKTLTKPAKPVVLDLPQQCPPDAEVTAAAAADTPPNMDSVALPSQEQPDRRLSVEEDLSLGAEDETKNVTVSSANILEVIFGSEQKSCDYRTIGSIAAGSDVREAKRVVSKSKDKDDVPVKPANDSKLQLKNDDFEMGSAEIVAVDPTKTLSGEDSDEDDSSPKLEESIVPSNHNPRDTIDDLDEIGSKNNQIKERHENVLCDSNTASMDVDEATNTIDSNVELLDSKPISPKAPEEEVLLKKQGGEIESEDNKTDEKTPAQVDQPEMSPDEPKLAESSTTKEPVPVLIIKKQSLPSRKLGDTVETMLTCSPKSKEGVASSPSEKPPNESLHVETVLETTVETNSPKHSPITLRIYKDNLTVKTDLDSPKRNKSPLSSEFKSELSPRLGMSENVSPQNKQLEFTLKIAKDVTTNQPKATMSPKHVASPTSVWKSEVHVEPAEKQLEASSGKLHRNPGSKTERQTNSSSTAQLSEPQKLDKPSPTLTAIANETGASMPEKVDKPLATASIENEYKPVVKLPPTRGRGRGRGSAARRTPTGRGRRGGLVGHRVKEEPIVLQDEDASEVKIKLEPESSSASPSLGLQMTDAFKKMMSQEKAGPQSEPVQPHPTPVKVEEPLTPVVKKRGRPRKSVQQVLQVPEELVSKAEPLSHALPSDASGNEAADDTPSGRPKRTCRGRTKPIVVRKKRGGSNASGLPKGSSTPLPIDPVEIKIEGSPLIAAASTTPTPTAVGPPETPLVAASPEKTPTALPPTGRGRGNFKRPTPDRNTLSEKELAELQKIEAKKEKLRLDRIAKYEAKKAKKLAKKLKDEERRKRQAQEKAEKAAAAAPQVFEEETRMSAPDNSSRGHTPAPPNRPMTGDVMGDESQNSTTAPGDSNRGNKKGRMEISIGDLDCLVKEVKVDDLAEYQWQGSELFMIQEQVSSYLGVKSFKRKYPGLKRRTVEAEERTFLEDSGLVPKSMCDLGITAVSSSEILDIMFQDFPEKYEEFRKHVRDKQAREASYKQKAAIALQRKDGTKVEPREQALEAVASWNANLNRERKEERKCALDLQTFTVHYPKIQRELMAKPTPKVGLYPVAVIPGQYCDFYKKYTPNELMYFPINTVLYGPLKPNERQKDGSDDGSASESSSSSSSSSSSGESSSESESDGEDPPKCTMCSGTKKKNKDSLPEVLLCCAQCKACYHPSCKEFTPEMSPHLVKYDWLCTACKNCAKCRDPNLKDRIMCCQLCDRGYHLSCIGLKRMPEGRWHCSVCAYCSSCDSRNPGGSDWQHEFKKGEKGTKVYQRTLCTPCFKLWRKGKYCQLCSKCHSMKPEEDANLIQCNSCDRWLHKECYGTKYGIQNKLLSTSSIQCDICVDRIQNSSMSGVNRSLIKV